MEFEWDDAKYATNLEKHAVRFEFAARVFLDPDHIDEQSPSPTELRRVAYGLIERRLYVVVYVGRGRVKRIISARKGNTREQKKYHSLQA